MPQFLLLWQVIKFFTTVVLFYQVYVKFFNHGCTQYSPVIAFEVFDAGLDKDFAENCSTVYVVQLCTAIHVLL